MLGALGGVTAIGMILSVRVDRRLPAVMWAIAVLLMAIYAFGL